MSGTTLGIAVMLASTSVMSVGMVIQKRAVDLLPPLEGLPLRRSIRALLGSRRWLVGYGCTFTGIVLNMVALGLADISIVQPLVGFGLVVLAVASRLYLGEPITRAAAAGIAFTVAGVALIGLLAPTSRVFASVDELLGVYRRPAALACLAGFAGAIAALWLLAARLRGEAAGVAYALVAALSSVVGLTFSKGLFGALTLVGLAAAAAVGPLYLLLVLMLTFATLAIALQQLSFQKGRALLVTPVFSASSVLLPLVLGRLVFEERVGPSSLLALAAVVFGVLLLSAGGPRTAPAPPPPAESR